MEAGGERSPSPGLGAATPCTPWWPPTQPGHPGRTRRDDASPARPHGGTPGKGCGLGEPVRPAGQERARTGRVLPQQGLAVGRGISAPMSAGAALGTRYLAPCRMGAVSGQFSAPSPTPSAMSAQCSAPAPPPFPPSHAQPVFPAPPMRESRPQPSPALPSPGPGTRGPLSSPGAVRQEARRAGAGSLGGIPPFQGPCHHPWGAGTPCITRLPTGAGG